MKMKRFAAKDMREALGMVREAFGPDAVIMSNSSTEQGVEVVAAVDFDESVIKENAPYYDPAPSKRTKAPIQLVEDHDVARLETQITEIKAMMRDYFRSTRLEQVEQNNTTVTAVLRKLYDYGVSGKVCQSLLKRLDNAADFEAVWQQSLTLLTSDLSVSEDSLIQSGGVHAFVGPTGVGKTTTIAKIAARFCLRYKPEHLALITTDNYRIAAFEQLATYGKILSVPVYHIDGLESLKSRLSKCQDKKLVLIDTAGLNQRDMRLQTQMDMLSDAHPNMNKVLVLAANSHPNTVRDVLTQVRRKQIQSCVLTKLDESLSLAHIVSALIEYKLPLSYVCHGQKVPEDIMPAQAEHIISSMIEIAQQSEQPATSFVDIFQKGAFNATV